MERKPPAAVNQEEANGNGVTEAEDAGKSAGEEAEDLDWVPPEIVLSPQEGMEELQELSEGVRTATFTDGVSDFNISGTTSARSSMRSMPRPEPACRP